MEVYPIVFAAVLIAAWMLFLWKSRSGRSVAASAKEESSAVEEVVSSGEKLTEVGPADNPWGIPIIDLRPITHTVVATSTDQQCAQNSVSYGRETGEVFFRHLPEFETRTECRLRYSLGGAEKLLPGTLFTPTSMDEKWAIFCDRNRIVFVRSWTREVVAYAEFENVGGEARVSVLHGDLQTGATGEFLIAQLDYLIRSHALDEVYPVPVEELTTDAALGLACFSLWGNRANCAGKFPLPEIKTETPLVSNSLLHIALAQNDASRVVELLDAGFPIDSLAQDGLATPHWASVAPSFEMLDLLLAKGCPIDVRSRQGATLLMTEAQGGEAEKLQYYLSKGADPNAKDQRGFTALHRSAEMGAEALVRVLLEAGADRAPDAEGHTPASLAKAGEHTAIVKLIGEHRD